MSFIKLGEEYYNELTIGRLFTKEQIDEETQETTTLYFAEMLGGQLVELTYEEYQSLIGE